MEPRGQKESLQDNDDKFNQIAAIHKAELNNTGFLSECSANTINLFYKSTAQYDSTILITDEGTDGEVKGYIFCTTNKNEYFDRFLSENKIRLMLSPSACLSLLKTMAKKLKKDRSHDQKVFDYDHEIVYMAVKHKYKRTGVAKRLVLLAEGELRKRGINSYCLQVFSENNSAIKFYESVGFKIIQSIAASGRSKYVMNKNLA